MSLDAILSRIDANQSAAQDRLLAFLAIPSISTDPDFKAQTRKAAEWLRDALVDLGATAELRDTPGHPMVTGETGGEGGNGAFRTTTGGVGGPRLHLAHLPGRGDEMAT